MQPLSRRTIPRGATEFYFRSSGNRLLVQTARSGQVTVCATAGDLTLPQREAFIRYLRAEGFITAGDASSAGFVECHWSQQNDPERWLVDATWSDADPTYALHLRRLRLCSLGVFIVWLTGMIVLVSF